MAAVAMTTTKYSFGDDKELLPGYAWYERNRPDGELSEYPAPVGELKCNAFGLFDTSGNVSEWVLDCGMPPYRSAPSDGTVAGRRSCDSHGHRGGSWDSAGEEVGVAYRNSASSPNQDRGFRLVREI